METSKIGAILKDLIKNRGYTQEEFAEITGIGLSSLKKYISGQVVYTVETLDTMATYLHCSYDYLLGKSHTPQRELQDLKEATMLSDGALEIIKQYAEGYEHNSYSHRYLDTLSNLIQSDFLVERIVNYFYLNTEEEYIANTESFFPSKYITVGDESLSVPDIEDAYLLGIVKALAAAKSNLGSDISRRYLNYKKINKRKDD